MSSCKTVAILTFCYINQSILISKLSTLLILSLYHIDILVPDDFGDVFIVSDDLFPDDHFFGNDLFSYNLDALFCDRDADDAFFII